MRLFLGILLTTSEILRRITQGTTMARIDSIGHLQVYNSHVEPTTEFAVHLADGSKGRAASPHGETVGVYERHGTLFDAPAVVAAMREDGILGRDLDQESFDAYLAGKVDSFGKDTCYALSLALFQALQAASPGAGEGALPGRRPRLCCNILNGGWHAYTNPVLSDFSEYLLVARTDDVATVLEAHAEIQRAVREGLSETAKAVVGGNTVNRFPTADNRECIEFLLGIRDRLGLASEFDLMIDAAAAGLATDAGYAFSITDGSVRSSDELLEYWLTIVDEYQLRHLEDPFGEGDTDAWHGLTTSGGGCLVIGDDLYCSDAGRIEEGAARSWTHGVIVKPNQAGSVTATRRAIDAAARTGQVAIASHRSVSTETPFEAVLTCTFGAPYIKIGPLMTDYSSVMRLNEIIRLTSEG